MECRPANAKVQGQDPAEPDEMTPEEVEARLVRIFEGHNKNLGRT